MSSKITGHWPKPHTYTGTRRDHVIPSSLLDFDSPEWRDNAAFKLFQALDAAIHFSRHQSLFVQESTLRSVNHDIEYYRAELRKALYTDPRTT